MNRITGNIVVLLIIFSVGHELRSRQLGREIEINEQFGKEVVDLLMSHSFKQVSLHQDLNGKDRFVSGVMG